MKWMQELADYGVARLDERALDALAGRGVSALQVQQYRVGCVRGELPECVPDEFRTWAEGKIDDVLLLPLTNTVGEILGFQLRSLDRAKPGYMDYMPDKREPCLFGLGQAAKAMWETRSVYLVEGAFDLFPIQRAFPAVVATLTARASVAFVRVLKRLVDKVWVGYDMDAAGRRGCSEFEREHGKQFAVYTVQYPKLAAVKDPGDLWELWGDSRLVPYIHELTKPRDPLAI